jgi:uncharacterized protein
MWKSFARVLLRNKVLFTSVVLILTAFMSFMASRMELSYEFAKILPETDSTFIEYRQFRSQFGEDGNVMVMGFEDRNFFTPQKFSDWYELNRRIKAIAGIKEILSVPTLSMLVSNDTIQKLQAHPIVTKVPSTQAGIDSIRDAMYKLPFYEGIIFNRETGAQLVAITFNKKALDSRRRMTIVKEITNLGAVYSKKHNVELHYSGMPYIRARFMTMVSAEMTLFLTLAIIVTAIILWLFFRSFSTVLYSLVITAIGVVWSIGIMQLFGYKITVLSGLIAPLIMVIGLPNCIFLVNKYHSEYSMHKNKVLALARMIETIGVTLFLANITTSIAFGVLYFTESSMLVEFGVVAAISVLATYFITLILIPVILYYMPAPRAKHTRHQTNPIITRSLAYVDHLVQHRRGTIYVITAMLTVVFFLGMLKIDMNGYVVDDLPEKDPVYSDLHFFQRHFKGVLPFEIALDTKERNGVFAENARALYKIKRLQSLMAEYPEFSKPLSVVEALKFSYQAHRGGDPRYYKLPPVTELRELKDYAGSVSNQTQRLSAFIDSTKQKTRISYQAADVGSKKMKELLAELRPRIDSIFEPENYHLTLTGHSLVFLKSNDYLLSNLIESLVIEIILIAIVGIALFRSVRIIVLSKLPCLIPLVITAGVMGFLDIRFKPSTILIFSIAFGISSDGTIYFLTKYRQELKRMRKTAPEAISIAIRETGLSMIYTSVILFCGFAIFTASSFGGTVALGVLVSLTLLLSMFSNLILLPAILLGIDRASIKKEIVEEPLIDISDNVEEGTKM